MAALAEMLPMLLAPSGSGGDSVATTAVRSTPTVLAMGLIAFSMMIVIIGIIVLSAAQSKVPGALLLLAGFSMGAGGVYIASRR